MKVQVSLDLNDDQRIAIAAAHSGRFGLATRQEARAWAEDAISKVLSEAEKTVKAERSRLIELLRLQDDAQKDVPKEEMRE